MRPNCSSCWPSPQRGRPGAQQSWVHRRSRLGSLGGPTTLKGFDQSKLLLDVRRRCKLETDHLCQLSALLVGVGVPHGARSEEHTSELQSLMRISYAVFCLKKKKQE